MALLLAFIMLPVFRATDIPPNPSSVTKARVTTLDGLRGFLAFAVFFQHAILYHQFLIDDIWTPPASHFYSKLGATGVSLFFMITGFLFWFQMIKVRGRPDWLAFLTGRVFRIMPVYLVMVFGMLAIVLSITGLHLRVPPIQLLKEVTKWLLGGYFASHVNGLETYHFTAGVTWSLRYEWLFYASLILTAVATRFPRFHLPFAIAGAMVCLTLIAIEHTEGGARPPSPTVCASLFFMGMTCASLAAQDLLIKLPDLLASGLVLALLCVLFICFGQTYSVGTVVTESLLFYLIISGCTVFGLLCSQPARRLGDISYNVYLLQGLVLCVAFALPGVRTFAFQNWQAYWVVILGCGLVLIGVSAVSHVYIERWGIKRGKKVSRYLKKRFET